MAVIAASAPVRVPSQWHRDRVHPRRVSAACTAGTMLLVKTLLSVVLGAALLAAAYNKTESDFEKENFDSLKCSACEAVAYELDRELQTRDIKARPGEWSSLCACMHRWEGW